MASLKAPQPTQNPEIPKKTPRLHELFREVRTNFCLLPCDTSQGTTEFFRRTCSDESDELFNFGWIFSGGLFSSEIFRIWQISACPVLSDFWGARFMHPPTPPWKHTPRVEGEYVKEEAGVYKKREGGQIRPLPSPFHYEGCLAARSLSEGSNVQEEGQSSARINNPTPNLGPAPAQKCVGDFCYINVGGFCRQLSWRILLGTFPHKWGEKSSDKIRKKIRRPKYKNPQKSPFCQKPTLTNLEIAKKTPHLHEFSEKFVRISACFPVTQLRKLIRHLSDTKPVQMNTHTHTYIYMYMYMYMYML